MIGAPADGPPFEVAIRFHRSVYPTPLPAELETETDQAVILAELELMEKSEDDAWVAQMREREAWIVTFCTA